MLLMIDHVFNAGHFSIHILSILLYDSNFIPEVVIYGISMSLRVVNVFGYSIFFRLHPFVGRENVDIAVFVARSVSRETRLSKPSITFKLRQFLTSILRRAVFAGPNDKLVKLSLKYGES